VQYATFDNGFHKFQVNYSTHIKDVSSKIVKKFTKSFKYNGKILNCACFNIFIISARCNL
jgi:hypothetical protein